MSHSMGFVGGALVSHLGWTAAEAIVQHPRKENRKIAFVTIIAAAQALWPQFVSAPMSLGIKVASAVHAVFWANRYYESLGNTKNIVRQAALPFAVTLIYAAGSELNKLDPFLIFFGAGAVSFTTSGFADLALRLMNR